MKISIEFGLTKREKNPKPEKLSDRWFLEMYEGKPRFIVTDKNMYSKGYVQCGRVGGIKRWGLKNIPDYEWDRVLVEVRKGKDR